MLFRLQNLIRRGLAAATVLAAGLACGQDLGDRQAFSLEDLAERTEILRNQFARMTPGEDAVVQEADWQWFEDADFAPAFLERLVGVRELGLWTWPLRAELEPGSLETVFLNADGDEAGRVWTDFAKAESARMSLRVPLVAAEDVQDFAYREELFAGGGRRVKASGEMPRLVGGATTNLAFTSIITTNRAAVLSLTNATGTVELFAYTMVHVPYVVTNVWTNDENFVVTNVATVWSNTSPSLCGFTNDWRILGRVEADSATRTAIFTNRAIAPQDKIRFYAAALLADADGDGLTDGFETFCSQTSSTLADSDGNGTPDFNEPNPATGVPYGWEQLARGLSVSLVADKPNWTYGGSIGWNQSLRFCCSNLAGVAVWATVHEAGYTPEAYTVSASNAYIAFERQLSNAGHTDTQVLLVPTNGPFALIVTDDSADSGIITENLRGADITAELESVCVDFIDVSCPQATSFGGSMLFQGHRVWDFDPTNSLQPTPHLPVFYEDVIDSDFVVQPFDVTLEAVILPETLPSDVVTGSWRVVSAPASGELLQTNEPTAIWRNPATGGVYRVAYDWGLPGVLQSEAVFVLPLAGAEIDAIIQTDLVLAAAFVGRVNAKYGKWQNAGVMGALRWFYFSASGDFLGRPDNGSSRTTWKYNQVNTGQKWGWGAVGTWRGYPTRVAKASNFLVGFACRRLGMIHGEGQLGQLLGTPNDLSAQKSWDAGWSIGGGEPYATTTENLLRDIWDEAGVKNRRLWPNGAAADNHVAPELFYDPDIQFKSPGFLYDVNP